MHIDGMPTTQPRGFADRKSPSVRQKTPPGFGTEFRDDVGSYHSAATTTICLDFGADFRDAESPDLRAFRSCPETYPLRDTSGKRTAGLELVVNLALTCFPFPIPEPEKYRNLYFR